MSASTGILMLSLSVALPLLERADLVAVPVAESAHDPSACPRAHDHTVCTQVGSNLSLAVPALEQRMAYRVVRVAAAEAVSTVRVASLAAANPQRAPPSA
jgi:hypothetical protein